MQDLLELLARTTLDLVESPYAALAKNPGTPMDTLLWRAFYALSRHLMVSNLLATPASPGIWLNLHRTYLAIRAHRVEKNQPENSDCDLQTYFGRILVLGAVPGVALTAQQWSFMHRFLGSTRAPILLSDTPPPDATPGILWLAPEQDMPPALLARREPTGNALTLYADIRPLINELTTHRDALGKTAPPAGLLPDEVSPRLAQITLANVLRHLLLPKKRRFPRRRQPYRANLCCGLTAIWELLQGKDQDPDTLSEWMVVNESPDGFAAMHISGRPQKVQVGDLIGLKRDDDSQWNVCIARWALSENPEHLELGLQMVAANPVSAHMATPGSASATRYPALLLPATPPLRPLDALAFLPTDHPAPGQKHLLIIDRPKLEIREFLVGMAVEESPSVDICLIRADDAI